MNIGIVISQTEPETVWNAYTYVNGDTLIITGMGEHPTNGLNGTYTIFQRESYCDNRF